MIYARDKIKYDKVVPIGKLSKITPNSNIFPSEVTSNMYGKKIRGSSFDHRPYTYISEEIDGVKVYDGSEVTLVIKQIVSMCLVNFIIAHWLE